MPRTQQTTTTKRNKQRVKQQAILPAIVPPAKKRGRRPVRKLIPGTLAWAFSIFPGGPSTALLFLKLAAKDKGINDPKIDDFLIEYAKLSKTAQEDSRSLDHVCARVGFPPKSFIGYVTSILFEARGHVDEFVRYMASSDLFMRSYKEGMKPSGFKDRTAILQQEGLHFAPKASSISIDARRQELHVEKGLPDFEETVHRVHDILANDDSNGEPLELSKSSAIELDMMKEKEKATV